MKEYSKFEPLYFTEEEAKIIRSLGKAMANKPFIACFANYPLFMRQLKKIVADGDLDYVLSVNRAQPGNFSLHLHKTSGYANLGFLDFWEPASVLHELDSIDFGYRVEIYLESALSNALERVNSGVYTYDPSEIESYVHARYGIRNFPDLTILRDVELDQETYDEIAIFKSQLDIIMGQEDASLRDAFEYIDHILDHHEPFVLTIDEMFLTHLNRNRNQIVFFEPKVEQGRLSFYESQIVSLGSEGEVRTSASAFSVRTDEQSADEYQSFLDFATVDQMPMYFKDMYYTAALNFLVNFDSNCKCEQTNEQMELLFA